MREFIPELLEVLEGLVFLNAQQSEGRQRSLENKALGIVHQRCPLSRPADEI
jgi:hypothetical protein